MSAVQRVKQIQGKAGWTFISLTTKSAAVSVDPTTQHLSVPNPLSVEPAATVYDGLDCRAEPVVEWSWRIVTVRRVNAAARKGPLAARPRSLDTGRLPFVTSTAIRNTYMYCTCTGADSDRRELSIAAPLAQPAGGSKFEI